MKPEKQRIAIAEAVYVINVNSKCWRGHKDGVEVSVPDYLSDLNAMHEAEKTLRENQFHFVSYIRELWKVIYPHVKYTGELGYLGFDYIHATAAQRAEAFLRTLNLWTDNE